MAQQAESESAAERVRTWLRTRILDGTYRPGALLSEGQVAGAVGVSRTPVREAFLQLAGEDMLELYPKRGALVVSVTTAELREVLVARSVIEPWAAARLARDPERAGVVERLRELTGDATAALEHGDDLAFQEADREFHQQLLSAAGNGLLSTFYSSLRDRQVRGGSLALHNEPRRGAESMVQHGLIADAIEAGRAEEAAAVIRSHLDDTALALGLSPLS